MVLFIQFAQPINLLAVLNLRERVLHVAQLLLHIRDAFLKVLNVVVIIAPRLGEGLKGSTYAGNLCPLFADVLSRALTKGLDSKS